MTIYFPDVSGWNGPPYKSLLDLRGAIAVQVKATEGTGYTSACYQLHKTEAAGHGAFFVGYHFLLHGNVTAQAQHCHAVVGTTPLSLDAEPAGTSKPTIADMVEFIDAYRRLGGTCYLLYLPRWYWMQLGQPSLQPFIDRHMVLHSSAYTTYTDADSGIGWQSYGGMKPAYWQYSDRVAFNGQAVDFSAYKGSYAGKQDPASVLACLAEFRSLATTGRLKPPPPPGPHGIAHGAWSFDFATGHWHFTRQHQPGALGFTQHPLQASVEFQVNMADAHIRWRPLAKNAPPLGR